MIDNVEDMKKIMYILGGLVLLIITCIIIMCEMDKKEIYVKRKKNLCNMTPENQSHKRISRGHVIF